MNLPPAQQNLVDGFANRLRDADALRTDDFLKEIENGEAYKNPGHPDHLATLHMIPLAIGRQMELAGTDPLASGTDSDSSMRDNQRFTYDPYPQEQEPDFSDEDRDYQKQRENTLDYMQKIRDGKAEGVTEENKSEALEGMQDFLKELDTEHETTVQARETELTRIDEQEDSWAAEKTIRSAEMKKDFMSTRLKGVLPDDRKQVTELA